MNKFFLNLTLILFSFEGLMRMQELIKAPAKFNLKVKIRQLTPGNQDARPLLKELKKDKEFFIIFDCSYRMASELLKQVITLSICSTHTSFLLRVKVFNHSSHYPKIPFTWFAQDFFVI